MIKLTPLQRRRWANFKQHKRGYWSLWIFLLMFFVSLFAEFIANDRPLIVRYDGEFFFPLHTEYPETTFGGEFSTETDYTDPFVTELINEKGWMIWPLIRFYHDTINYSVEITPSAPTATNWLGTDDQGRDVLARAIYGFRISIVFGLALTLLSSVIGVLVGAIQGYFGGLTDLIGQRFIEIWSGLPALFILIILRQTITPNIWWLLLIMLLFSWMALVGVVRAEFLKGRNAKYVQAAQALGVDNKTIMFRHILPNAMVATLTFLPFILSGAIVTLTSLDYMGLGLPPGSPSLGEMLVQGRDNLNSPWLSLTSFFVLSFMLTLLVMIGEAVRDAFDPGKNN